MYIGLLIDRDVAEKRDDKLINLTTNHHPCPPVTTPRFHHLLPTQLVIPTSHIFNLIFLLIKNKRNVRLKNVASGCDQSCRQWMLDI